MEVWIRNVGTGQGHYMGSIDYNNDFTSLGGNPGSFGYWVMSNHNPGSTWTKVSGYISGFGTSTGQFVTGTKYWTPQALFNYTAGTGTRACIISGWKIINVSRHGNRTFSGTITASGGNSGNWNTAFTERRQWDGGSSNLNATTGRASLNVPTRTGGDASGTWGINITGNASTATTLQTARTINGTSFNGSANITTANWGTSRTLTIGNTGKAVNGSGNVSWTLSEIGALGTSGSQLISKNVHASGASDYHLELNSPNVDSAGEISLRFHQGSQWWGQIRFRSDGFHFTQGSDNNYRNIFFGTATGNLIGNASTVTNGVYTTGSYANPAWITSLAWSKLTSIPDASSGTAGIVNIGAQTFGGAKTFNATPLTLSADTATLNFSSGAGTKTISTGGSTHLNLAPGGNVGVGTATPAVKLHVQGSSIRLLSGNLTTNTEFAIGRTGVDGWLALAGGASAYSSGSLQGDLVLGSVGKTHIPGRTNGGGIGIVVDSSSDVGIGITAPAQKLHVVGQIVATGDITAYYSDQRLKTNLGKISNPLEIINSLSGFRYTNNEVAKSLGYKEENIQIGLSAQEVQNVLPELVSLAPIDMEKDEKTGKIKSKSGENYLTVKYDKLVPVLVEAIKELNEQNKNKEEKIKNIDKELKELKALVQGIIS
jgi:hypothetical protein